MKTEKNIPELRFPEFHGEWVEKKLYSISEWKSGGTPSKEREDFWGGEIPWITAASMRGHRYSNSEYYITDEGASNGTTLVEKGTILILVRGSMLFKHIPVGIAERTLSFNQDVKALTFQYPFQHEFMLNWFHSKEPLILNMVLETGIGAGKLDTNDLKNLVVFSPSKSEQTKIASFLSSADQRINMLTQKKEKLEQYKKGIMQQIFSQQLRFKDENGKDYPEWEEKKISDVFSITRGYVLSFNEIMQEKDKIYKFPVYSSQTKNNGLSGYYYKSLYSNAITWTTDGANAGEVRYREGNFYCTNVCGVLVSKEGYANECIASMLNSVTKKYVSYVGNPKLMNNVMGNISILFPSIDEQQKIASFLSSLDQKISLVNQQIELTRRWKQGLLQKMFV